MCRTDKCEIRLPKTWKGERVEYQRKGQRNKCSWSKQIHFRLYKWENKINVMNIVITEAAAGGVL